MGLVSGAAEFMGMIILQAHDAAAAPGAGLVGASRLRTSQWLDCTVQSIRLFATHCR